MARAITGLLVVAALATAAPATARGLHVGGLFGHVHHGHPINAWQGSHHLRLR